jgi:hypothetical protein
MIIIGVASTVVLCITHVKCISLLKKRAESGYHDQSIESPDLIFFQIHVCGKLNDYRLNAIAITVNLH